MHQIVQNALTGASWCGTGVVCYCYSSSICAVIRFTSPDLCLSLLLQGFAALVGFGGNTDSPQSFAQELSDEKFNHHKSLCAVSVAAGFICNLFSFFFFFLKTLFLCAKHTYKKTPKHISLLQMFTVECKRWEVIAWMEACKLN